MSSELLMYVQFVFRGNTTCSLYNFKIGLSPSKKFFIYFYDSPSKMTKNVFYFILKALVVLKIFKFL